MSKVVIGFIGCGAMAAEHCAALKALWEAGCREFEVAAVCDIVEAKSAKMAAEFESFTGKKPAAYTDAETMLAKEKSIQSVLVITPHNTHHVLAVMAMKAGVNVMTEKPIGITVRAAKIMIDAAKETGKFLHIAENYRMELKERAVHWAITSGMAGTPRVLNWIDVGERKWYWDWRDHVDIAGGAWTFDGGVHHSDLFQYSLGPVKRVCAVSRAYDTTRYQKFESVADYEQAKLEKRYAYFRQTRSLKNINPETLEEPIQATVEDTTAAILEFESGVVGTWLVSRSAAGKVDRSNVVYGSEGAVFWYDGVYNARQEQVYTHDELNKAFLKSLDEEQKEILFPYGVFNSLSIEWKQHFDAVNGVRPVEVTDKIGLMAMAVPMAIYESAESGEPVLIQDVLDLKVEAYQSKLNKPLGI